jgi:hypothetical protein
MWRLLLAAVACARAAALRIDDLVGFFESQYSVALSRSPSVAKYPTNGAPAEYGGRAMNALMLDAWQYTRRGAAPWAFDAATE